MSYGRPPPRIDGMVSLKVDNLTYRTTPEDLRRVFERCGEVGDIYIPRDRYTRESRGFAFVRYVKKNMYLYDVTRRFNAMMRPISVPRRQHDMLSSSYGYNVWQLRVLQNSMFIVLYY